MSIPAAASVQTPEGAVAFVEFYFAQVNKAWMTPDATLLPALAEPTCQSCAAFQASAVELAASHQRYASEAVAVLSPEPIAGANADELMISLKVHQLAAPVLDAGGKVVSTESDKTYNSRALLTWKGGKWSLSDVGNV